MNYGDERKRALQVAQITLSVVKDYESAFETVTLKQIYKISLSDVQPLSVDKINIFHQQPGFYRKIFQ